MLFSISHHEIYNIIMADLGVFENGAHLTKLVFQMLGDTNIHFLAPKQTLISHLAQYLLRAHYLNFVQSSSYFRGNKSLQLMVGSFQMAQLTLPLLCYVISFTVNVLGVGSRFFPQFSHGFLALFVKVFRPPVVYDLPCTSQCCSADV